MKVDRQGGMSIGGTYISPSVGIDINQQVVMTAGGALYPTYLQIGNLKIYQDGSIYSGNREIIDAQGNINASCINWGQGDVIQTPNYTPTTTPANVYTGTALDY